VRHLLQAAARFAHERAASRISYEDMAAAVVEYSCLSALDVEGVDAMFCQKRFPMYWGLLKRYTQVCV
jgi:hypothetical protein